MLCLSLIGAEELVAFIRSRTSLAALLASFFFRSVKVNRITTKKLLSYNIINKK